jgi:hypothetical protein
MRTSPPSRDIHRTKQPCLEHFRHTSCGRQLTTLEQHHHQQIIPSKNCRSAEVRRRACMMPPRTHQSKHDRRARVPAPRDKDGVRPWADEGIRWRCLRRWHRTRRHALGLERLHDEREGALSVWSGNNGDNAVTDDTVITTVSTGWRRLAIQFAGARITKSSGQSDRLAFATPFWPSCAIDQQMSLSRCGAVRVCDR